MFSNKVTKQSIESKSQKALGIFHTAISTLEEANTEAQQLKTQNEERIRSLQEENQEVDKTLTSNVKVVNNFRKMLG